MEVWKAKITPFSTKVFVLMGTSPAQPTALLKARETLNSLLVKPLLGQ